MAINLDNVQPYVVTPTLNDKIWLFYGEMGTRKTSVACKFPNHLLLAADIGYKLINGAMAVPLQSWSDFKSAVKQLDKQSNKDKFKTIIIDTVGMVYQMCFQYMLTQMGVQDPGEVPFGMGWKKIRNEFESVVRSIVQKGYGLVMLAHSDEVEKEDKATKKKVTVTKIDIDKRPDLIIKGLADFVLYLHKEPSDEDQSVPSVYAYSDLAEIDTKSRSRYFSRRFEFTYDNLQLELTKAVQAQYAVEQQQMPTGVIEQSNPYVTEEVDFEQLKSDTIAVATLLTENGYDEKVGKLLLDVFKGVRLSQLENTQENVNKLTVVYSTLLDLKSEARI